MNKSLLFISVLFISILTFSQAQAVSTYKWMGADGSVHYTQHPPAEGIAFEKIQTIRPSRSSTGTGSTSSTTARNSILADQEKHEKNELVDKETAKNTDVRKKNCEASKKRLAFFQVQRRWKDKDGNIQSINDAERKTKIEEAKQHMKDFCD